MDFSAQSIRFILCVALALANGAIGFIDDARKLFKKQNEGLKAAEKFMLQLIIAALFLLGMSRFGGLTTELYLPFIGKSLELGKFYYVLMLFLIVGVTNSVNLTDGIDGLASCVTAVVAAFFAVCGAVAANEGALYLAGAVFGGCLGFLVYNFHPAKIFMGDTGSLFLGGIVTGLAFLCDQPIILLIVGLIYLIETASVILQVGSYKIFHKRIFKMAPIHHHFEKCGWGERKIVIVASAITLVLSAVSFIFSL
jgi:phospho-N-acetylmuramoyl-pentapeptide-transferase